MLRVTGFGPVEDRAIDLRFSESDSWDAPPEFRAGEGRYRGEILGMDARGNAQVIDAMVPLANMFGYVNTLRSMTQGRAAYTMTFDHYAPVPQAVADEVVAKLAG